VDGNVGEEKSHPGKKAEGEVEQVEDELEEGLPELLLERKEVPW
jgi:hypothetical protein